MLSSVQPQHSQHSKTNLGAENTLFKRNTTYCIQGQEITYDPENQTNHQILSLEKGTDPSDIKLPQSTGVGY